MNNKKKEKNYKLYMNIFIILIIILFLGLYIYIIYINKKDTFENENIDTKNPKKIAFLFLTYNNIKRPDIWNNFLDSKDSNKFTLYNHAKEPTKVSDILKGTQIKEYIDTCWGCFGSVEANILMMKEALKDPLNKKFMLVSETCVPLVTFDKLYNEIMKDDKSRINVNFHNCR